MNSDSNRVEEEVPLCYNCLNSIKDSNHFCTTCGAPISFFSTIGPWERILAEGYALRQATERPTKLIVVIGIWIMYVPALLVCIVYGFEMLLDGGWMNIGGILCMAPYYLFFGYFSSQLVYLATKNYLMLSRKKKLKISK